MSGKSEITIRLLILIGASMIIIQCAYSQDSESYPPFYPPIRPVNTDPTPIPTAISYHDINENQEKTLYHIDEPDLPPANNLSILFETNMGWNELAQCPKDRWVSMLLCTNLQGPLTFIEIYPDSYIKTYKLDCRNPGYNRLWYYSNDIGRHTVFFMMKDNASNEAKIEVI